MAIARFSAIRERLRIETEDLHRRVEEAMPSLDELTQRDTYIRSLQTLRPIYHGWEATLTDVPGLEGWFPGLELRSKLAKIDADLAFLGVSDLRTGVKREISLAEAVGAIYVLEGATLGGQVITHHIAAPLGLNPPEGISFFSGYGLETGERWREAIEGIEQFTEQTGEDDTVIAGARACFLDFEQQLIQEGNDRK